MPLTASGTRDLVFALPPPKIRSLLYMRDEAGYPIENVDNADLGS